MGIDVMSIFWKQGISGCNRQFALSRVLILLKLSCHCEEGFGPTIPAVAPGGK
jgi:hypothetical protein